MQLSDLLMVVKFSYHNDRKSHVALAPRRFNHSRLVMKSMITPCKNSEDSTNLLKGTYGASPLCRCTLGAQTGKTEENKEHFLVVKKWRLSKSMALLCSIRTWRGNNFKSFKRHKGTRCWLLLYSANLPPDIDMCHLTWNSWRWISHSSHIKVNTEHLQCLPHHCLLVPCTIEIM